MKTVALLGASGGIGAALLDLLSQRDDVSLIHASYYRSPAASSLGSVASFGGATRVVWTCVDATDESAVAAWVDSLGAIDWLINCAGMLHNPTQGPEKSIRAFDPQHFQESLSINCLPTLLLGKYAAPALAKSPQGVFAVISARVGSISDNRLGGWYSYRASKSALNMAVKCLAIEWSRTMKNVKVVALHPGTTDSRLSRPFQKHVAEGKLFTPETTARLLIRQIEQLHEHESGRFIAYDGEEIPW